MCVQIEPTSLPGPGDKSGVKPDPDKVKAIRVLPEPQNVQDLKRVLVMFRYMGMYIPHL